MNCSNCGAPMRLTDETGHFVCRFCNTHAMAGEDFVSADQIKMTKQPVDLCCPVCPDQPQLFEGMIEKFKTPYCPQCLGFTIDSESFQVLVRVKRATFKGVELKPRPIDPEQLQRRVSCPTCQQIMDVHPYYGPGNSVIDSCHRCKRIWLDHGETTRIIKSPGVR